MILPASIKTMARNGMSLRYGSNDDVYLRAVEDQFSQQSEDFKVKVDWLGQFDERILTHHIASRIKDANLLKVKMRLTAIWQFVNECVGEVKDSDAVIDVGAASGVFLEMFGKKGKAVDVWEPAVNDMLSYGMDAVVAEGESLPFDDDSFAYGFALETLEHSLSPVLVLKEMNRICTRGIFASIPYREQSSVAHVHPGSSVPAQHIFELAPKDFCKLAEHCGLKVRAHRNVHLHGPGKGGERILRSRSGYLQPSVAVFFLQHGLQ